MSTKPKSEFEALIEQGWTLIDPDGNVWRQEPPLMPPKRRDIVPLLDADLNPVERCICPQDGATALCPIHGLPDELKGGAV